MLRDAHRGYEYQDLATVYLLFKEILANSLKSEFFIDHKENQHDIFDDLSIRRADRENSKIQFKYNNPNNEKYLNEGGFFSPSSRISLLKLYSSYLNSHFEKKTTLHIIATWLVPEESITSYLSVAADSNRLFPDNSTKVYRLNVDSVWEKINNDFTDSGREKFQEFSKHFFIELAAPDASFDVKTPGTLEQVYCPQLRNSLN